MEVYAVQLVMFLLLFARIASMVAVAPFVGDQAIPPQVKVALSLFLALVFSPLVSAQAGTVDLQLGALALLALKEVVAGLVIGFAAGLVFAAVRAAGELIGFELGFSLASAFDPEAGQNNTIVARFFGLSMIMVFLLVNGHHFLFEALQMSYAAIPIGKFALTGAVSGHMVRLSGIVFTVAIKLAAPVIVASFLVNVAMAVLARVSPQINVFFVSLPLKVGVGLLVLMASGPMVVFVFKKLLAGFEANLLDLVKAL
jgi:flagellar biosynthetic protein FliR